MNAFYFSQQVKRSQLIFQGTLTEVAVRLSKSSQANQQEQPYTFFSFSVDRIIKGSIAGGGNTLTIRIKGAQLPVDEQGNFKFMTIIERNLIDGTETEVYHFKNNKVVATDSLRLEQLLATKKTGKNSKLFLRFDNGELLITPDGGIAYSQPNVPMLKEGDQIILLLAYDDEKQRPLIDSDHSWCLLNLPNKGKNAWITQEKEILSKPPSATEMKRQELEHLLQEHDVNKSTDSQEIMTRFGTTDPKDIQIDEPAWMPPKGAKPYTPASFADIVVQKIQQELAKQPVTPLVPIESEDSDKPFFDDL